MVLFLDRFPFQSWTDYTRTPPAQYWSVVLPVVLAEAQSGSPPASAPIQYWVLDTGNRGEAFAWRQHLLDAGLDPDADRVLPPVAITSVAGGKVIAPIRAAALWLVSNLPAFQQTPFPVPLVPGLPFHDVAALPDPHFHRPLLGVRALRRAGLKVDIDFGNDNVSVWVPDPATPTTQP